MQNFEELNLTDQELHNKPIYNYEIRKSSESFSYNEFFWDFMNSNELVIIENVSNNWPCRKDWVKDDKVNFDYLSDKFKNLVVPVADNSKEFFNSHVKLDMKFSDYIEYWKQDEETRKQQLLYLKDWHLKAAKPEYNFYKVPKYFASDWLNEYLLDQKLDDYRFVYMGPKGSWTPFHADVFSSFSWSTNIVGKKKWIFLPPGEEQKLKDSLNNFPFRLDEEILKTENIKHYTIIQQENESIFVPSNWYHEVWNLTDTISVNHNFFNGCNVHQIWKSLKQNLNGVVREIEDCRDMNNFEEHCQKMLKASFGMNYLDFLSLLEHIAKKRKSQVNFELFDTFTMSQFHKNFDLRRIYKLIDEISMDFDVRKCEDLYNKIESFRN